MTDNCLFRLLCLGWGCGLNEFCGPSVTQWAQHSVSGSYCGRSAEATGNFHPRILRIYFLELPRALFTIQYGSVTHELNKPFMNPNILVCSTSSGYLIRSTSLWSPKDHYHINEHSVSWSPDPARHSQMSPITMFWGLVNKFMFAVKTPFILKIKGNFRNSLLLTPPPQVY